MSARSTVARGALLAALALLAGCSGESPAADPDHDAAGHVHGLGLNPADDSLYVATHTGVFEVDDDGTRRIADRYQDTMGFAVAGPDRFLASGHPDLREDLPVHLGLIESTDAARTWTPLSLQGESDFHALDVVEGAIYGYDSVNQELKVSGRGKTWTVLERGPLIDIAVTGTTAGTAEVWATSPEARLMRLDDGRLQLVGSAPPLVFIDPGPGGDLVGVSPDGTVHHSDDGGFRWRPAGRLPGEPQAVAAEDGRWFVATSAGIHESTDEGRRWTTAVVLD